MTFPAIPTARRAVSPTLAAALIALTLLCGEIAQAAYLGMDGRMVPLEAVAQPKTRPETVPEREYRLGVQELVRQDSTSARARFDAALRSDAKFVPALIGLASVAQAAGNLDQSRRYLDRAAQLAPDSPALALARGRYHLAIGELPRAEQQLKRARDLSPQAVGPLLELGDLYLRQPGRAADALTSFQSAVALDANNKFVQYGLGVALAANGQRPQALAALIRTSELAPKDPAPLRMAGRLYLEVGQPEQALAAFDAGLARQPKALPVMLDRVDALARLSRWKEALTQMEAAEKLAPNSFDVQLKLGDVFQATERWRQATASYRKAINTAPKNPLPYNNLAWSIVASGGDAKQAVQWASKAVELSPGSSPFHDTLGWAQRAAGQLPEAQASVAKAIELEPKVAVYHLHRAVLSEALQQPDLAREAFKRAVTLDPKLRDSPEAKALLARLPGL